MSGRARVEYEQWLIALGQTIRRERQAQRLSIEALAHKAGVTSAHLGRIERGQVKLRVTTLYALAQALGVTVVSLMVAADDETA